MKLVAIILCVACLGSGFTLQGRPVRLHHPEPHVLSLTWGPTLIDRWWVRCVPHYPHIVMAWVNLGVDHVEMWYCGGYHFRAWLPILKP